ncbi:hypothetical protein L195_g058764, partial [Trifolium pratense]
RYYEAHTSIWHNIFDRRTSMASCTVCLSIDMHNEVHILQFHA